jgi:hypothetical protein
VHGLIVLLLFERMSRIKPTVDSVPTGLTRDQSKTSIASKVRNIDGNRLPRRSVQADKSSGAPVSPAMAGVTIGMSAQVNQKIPVMVDTSLGPKGAEGSSGNNPVVNIGLEDATEDGEIHSLGSKSTETNDNKVDKDGCGLGSVPGCDESGVAGCVLKPTGTVSYAAKVSGLEEKKVNFRQLVGIKQHGVDVVLTRESVRMVQDKMEFTLYGYFLGSVLLFLLLIIF